MDGDLRVRYFHAFVDITSSRFINQKERFLITWYYLQNMVMSFRVTELQTLLAYAGKNRSGRKNELQARALELVKNKSSPIVSKIKELYRTIQ